MNSILHFIGKLIRSRLGWALLVINLSVMVLVFAQKAPQTGDCTWAEFQQAGVDYILLGGRGVHIGVESALFQVVMLVNLPSLIIGYVLIEFVLTGLYSQLPVITASWIDAGVLLLFSSIQWLLVGYGLCSSSKGMKDSGVNQDAV